MRPAKSYDGTGRAYDSDLILVQLQDPEKGFGVCGPGVVGPADRCWERLVVSRLVQGLDPPKVSPTAEKV